MVEVCMASKKIRMMVEMMFYCSLVDLWTIRSTEWQIKGVRSLGRLKRRWRDDIVGQQGVGWTKTAKDRESWRTLEERYFLQWQDIAKI